MNPAGSMQTPVMSACACNPVGSTQTPVMSTCACNPVGSLQTPGPRRWRGDSQLAQALEEESPPATPPTGSTTEGETVVAWRHVLCEKALPQVPQVSFGTCSSLAGTGWNRVEQGEPRTVTHHMRQTVPSSGLWNCGIGDKGMDHFQPVLLDTICQICGFAGLLSCARDHDYRAGSGGGA